VKAISFVAAALLAAGTTAYAQEPPAAQDARPPVTPTLSVKFPPMAPVASAAQKTASREDIKAMEALLTNALQKGAQDLAQRMAASEPGSRFVTGTGRARGFALEGYGVFFDVEVPGMKQSLIWSAEMLRQIQQAQNLRQYIATSSDGPARRFAEMELGRLERQMNSVRPSPSEQALRSGQAQAQSVAESNTIPDTSLSTGAGARTGVAADLRDPNELYTDAVKNALIDAMLKYTSFLKIGQEEWLTVAARDSEGPLMPGQIDDASTIMISIKGSDLAAFQSNKLTREEVLKKVVVREF
jgi:hypothetical protein